MLLDKIWMNRITDVGNGPMDTGWGRRAWTTESGIDIHAVLLRKPDEKNGARGNEPVPAKAGGRKRCGSNPRCLDPN